MKKLRSDIYFIALSVSGVSSWFFDGEQKFILIAQSVVFFMFWIGISLEADND